MSEALNHLDSSDATECNFLDYKLQQFPPTSKECPGFNFTQPVRV